MTLYSAGLKTMASHDPRARVLIWPQRGLSARFQNSRCFSCCSPSPHHAPLRLAAPPHHLAQLCAAQGRGCVLLSALSPSVVLLHKGAPLGLVPAVPSHKRAPCTGSGVSSEPCLPTSGHSAQRVSMACSTPKGWWAEARNTLGHVTADWRVGGLY